MAKKLKKAILAGLTAYAASKYLKGKKMPTDYEHEASLIKKPFKHDLEAISPRKPGHLGDKGGSMDHMVPKKWYEFWKKHGGSVTTAKLGKMIKAAQGTYAREDESLGMRLGKGKGTAKERDMSYGDWGKRKHDWAKSGKMIKARQGTYAREDESLGMRLGKGKGTAKERDMSYGDWGKRKTDWASKGKMVKARGGVYVNTKLNGKLFTETF